MIPKYLVIKQVYYIGNGKHDTVYLGLYNYTTKKHARLSKWQMKSKLKREYEREGKFFEVWDQERFNQYMEEEKIRNRKKEVDQHD